MDGHGAVVSSFLLPWVAIGQWLFGLENHTNVSARMYLIRACFSVAYRPRPCLYLSVANSRARAESKSVRRAASLPASGTTPPLASGKPVRDLERVCRRLSPLASWVGCRRPRLILRESFFRFCRGVGPQKRTAWRMFFFGDGAIICVEGATHSGSLQRFRKRR